MRGKILKTLKDAMKQVEQEKGTDLQENNNNKKSLQKPNLLHH